MKTLSILIGKEFRQIFRNRALLPILFVAPLAQLLILPLAADFEVKNIDIAIVDHDRSAQSQRLVSTITASGYFRLADGGGAFRTAFAEMEADRADLILEIPRGFERNLLREDREKLFVAINAINGVKAGLGGGYLARIIAEHNADILTERSAPPKPAPAPRIEIVSSNWFNPAMDYRFYMVPGILVLLVTMIGAYMCALNIVKEKEMGTIEQINVTPVPKHLFILGKLIPFWAIGMVVFSIGLFGVGMLVYGIVPVGSLLLLYAYLAIYLVAVLGLGLLISTHCETQQQAMSVAFFFMMVFVLMSGLFTPTDSMPPWAYAITQCSPITYFMEAVRMIVLKGSTLADLKGHFLLMFGFAGLLNGWAVMNYRKTG